MAEYGKACGTTIAIKVETAPGKTRTSTILIPGSWDEVQGKHLAVVAATIINQEPAIDALCKYLITFGQITSKQYLAIPTDCLPKLLEVLKFTAEPVCFPHSKIKRLGLLQGPDDLLKNVDIKTFGLACDFADAYANTTDVAYLDKMMATLYKSPALSDTLVLSAMKHVRLSTKQAAWLNFLGLKNYVLELYPNLKKQGEGTKKGSWLSLITALSGAKFGAFAETEKTGLHIILNFLNEEK